MTSLKVINIYHIPYSITKEQQRGREGKRTAVTPTLETQDLVSM